jgi:hypothetical protein
MEDQSMRNLKIIGMAIAAVTALSAIASGMATAARPEFLVSGGFPIKFTGRSGPGTLAIAGGNTIECKKTKFTGEVLSAKTADLTSDIEECTIFGIVNAHSLGDPANVILVTSSAELCYLSKAANPPKVGLRITPTGKIHVEVAGELALIEGSIIGVLTPVNTRTLEFRLSLNASMAGKQEQLRCEGGAETHFSVSENEGAAKAASEALQNVIGLLREEGEIAA